MKVIEKKKEGRFGKVIFRIVPMLNFGATLYLKIGSIQLHIVFLVFELYLVLHEERKTIKIRHNLQKRIEEINKATALKKKLRIVK